MLLSKSNRKWLSILSFATFLSCAALWQSGQLLAQTKAVSTPEEVSQDFLGLLSGVNNARYHTDIYFQVDEASPVSQKSWRELKGKASLLVTHLAGQLRQPHFKATKLVENERQARVQVRRDDAAYPHDVVLFKENGQWRVDLVATYAAWNKITEAQAKKRILNTWGQAQ